MPSSKSSTADDTGRPAKRKRVALACDTCRDRKIRCDGTKPVCTPCAKRGESILACTYVVVAHSAKHTSEQEYIVSLQRQVEQLHSVIGQLRGPSQDRQGVEDQSGGDRSQDETTYEDHSAGIIVHSSPATRIAPTSTPHDRRMEGDGQSPVSATRVSRPAPDATPQDLSAIILSPEARGSCITGNADASSSTLHGAGHSPVDAMGTSTAVRSPVHITRSDEFYGQSSVLSLLQEVPRPRSRHPNVPLATRQSMPGLNDDGRSPSRGPGSHDTMLGAEYALPPRWIADKLLDLYFDNVHIFYPWTHSTSIRSYYESLWTRQGQAGQKPGEQSDIGLGGDRCPPSVFLCALNAMFALGCEFSDFAEKESASSTFYGRVRGLLSMELLDHGSVSYVQALLLSGLYLLTTEFPTRCYNFIGLACRMGIGLGLHSDKPPPQQPVLVTQIRRRVWHACLQMEMTVSMTLGRPPSLRVDDAVPLPAAVDDEFLSGDSDQCEQPAGRESQNLFMVENIKLARILGMILDRIYHPQPRDRPIAGQPDLSVLVHVDSLLEAFKAALPSSLVWDSEATEKTSSGIDSVLRRQSHVLRARFFHLRILLHRPNFSAFCASARPELRRREAPDPFTLKKPDDHGLGASFRDRSAEICVTTACDLIDSVRNATLANATGAWWFSLFYLVTCGVVVILTECTQAKRQWFDQERLNTAWERCMETLQHLGAIHPRVQAHIESLRMLRDRGLSAYHPSSTWMSRNPSRENGQTTTFPQTRYGTPMVPPGMGSTMGGGGNSDIEAGQEYTDGWNFGMIEHDGGFVSLLEGWDTSIENFMLNSTALNDYTSGFL